MRLEHISEIIEEMKAYEIMLKEKYEYAKMTPSEAQTLSGYHTTELNLILLSKYPLVKDIAMVHFSLTQGIFITINDLF